MKSIFSIMVAAIVGIILLLTAITFQVRFGEVAVVTTFDKPTRSITEAGLYFKFPFPVQKVRKFDARLQVFDGRIEETFTKDAKNIIVLGTVAWRIKDPLKFLTSLGNFYEAQKNLEGLVRSYQNAVIGTYPLSSFISTDREKMKFDQIEEDILRPVAKESYERYGIEIAFFKIKRLLLPEAVTEKVFERMREERKRLSKKYRAEGEAEAIRIRAMADSEKEKIIVRAESQGRIIKGQADAEAAKYYEVFKENEEFAIFLKKLEALEETLKQKSTVILDTRTPPFDLLEGEKDSR
ncbi:hypothetical protein B9J78_04190 [bacterium Unc6]|nr:hypothetical protein [bacterium Unc6]